MWKFWKKKMTEFEALVKSLEDPERTKDQLFLRNLLRDYMDVSLNEIAPRITDALPENFQKHNPLEFENDVNVARNLTNLGVLNEMGKDHIKVLDTYLNHKYKVRFLNELFNRCCIIRFARNTVRR